MRQTTTTAPFLRPPHWRACRTRRIKCCRSLRHFLTAHGTKLWRRFGFVDAFCEGANWYADSYIAIDQGPIVVMMENHRTGLLWNLFMSAPEVRTGLRRLGFTSPWLKAD